MFHRPTPESKLTSSLNGLLEPDGLNQGWKLARQGAAQVHWGGEAVGVKTPGALVGTDGRLLAWQWYWVNGAVTANPARAVLFQMLARFGGRSEVSAWVTVYTEDGEDPSVAPRVLDRIRRRHVRIDRRGACLGGLDTCRHLGGSRPPIARAGSWSKGPPTIVAVSETPPQQARPCPQCSQAMAHLVLQGHQAKDVVVDHCAACRLVRFDALESVQLSGRGWVQALRELQRGARGEPSAHRPAVLRCPSTATH